jgi:hypothetical protein
MFEAAGTVNCLRSRRTSALPLTIEEGRAMRPSKSLIVASLLLLPSLAIAETQVFRCHAPHFVRNAGPAGPDPGGMGPTELRFTVIYFDNRDLEHPAVIERLTVRDARGVVRHDSGPKTSTPHPLVLGQDITTVPPGATFGFGTTSLWGFNHPPFAAPSTSGLGLFLADGLSMTVEVSKAGKPRLLLVHGRQSDRARITDPPTVPVSLGEERSSQMTRCARIRDRDDG